MLKLSSIKVEVDRFSFKHRQSLKNINGIDLNINCRRLGIV
jgi:hypothetical protein